METTGKAHRISMIFTDCRLREVGRKTQVFKGQKCVTLFKCIDWRIDLTIALHAECGLCANLNERVKRNGGRAKLMAVSTALPQVYLMT